MAEAVNGANVNDREDLDALEERIRTLLPDEYKDSYEDVEPVSMGSAGLRFDRDNRVAWNEMWASFCDLAMAGGPPHRGSLLEPATPADVDAHADRYRLILAEICRGVTMVTYLPVHPSVVPGWVRVTCLTEGMAGWLLRAIVMENVAARAYGRALDLPASPHFRIEKEVKNVVTVMAKTCHYWVDHTSLAQESAIGHIFKTLDTTTPLIVPVAFDPSDDLTERRQRALAALTDAVGRESGLRVASGRYSDWFGVECSSVRTAIWMMRAMVASNVLARREETTLFVPFNPGSDPDGSRVASTVVRMHRLAALKGIA